jgi:hypothetical protein
MSDTRSKRNKEPGEKKHKAALDQIKQARHNSEHVKRSVQYTVISIQLLKTDR